MKRARKVISLLAVLCMVLTMNLTAFATATDATPAVAEARNGVIQVRLYYVDKAGTAYWLQSGSGFLIGASSGATTVITNYHVVTLPDYSGDANTWDKEKASEAFGVDFFNSNEVHMEIRVAVKRDVEITAGYINGSEQTDFAILELSQAIYDRTPLALADSASLVETQNIYALGFPGVTANIQDDQVYTVDDVTITNGIVGKFQDISNINFVLHNAQLGHGNSGGPLVNSNGEVVGVNTLFYGDESGTYYSSIAINEIAEVLDALGIQYTSSNTAEPEPEPVPEIKNDTKTEDNTDTTQELPEKVDTKPIPDPVLDPEPAEENTKMYLIIGGVALVVVVAGVIIAVVVSSKSKKKQAPTMQNNAMPIPPVPPVGGRNAGAPVPPSFGGTMPADTGAGETSVLGGGAGETSVLGGGAMQPTAKLIRRKNGETASITKQLFVIGKERQKVDFCVPDNNSVSRNHANILCKGGVYYIVDKNSTNFTFVNGNKINPNQEVKLNSGDKIKLADEEFEFRV